LETEIKTKLAEELMLWFDLLKVSLEDRKKVISCTYTLTTKKIKGNSSSCSENTLTNWVKPQKKLLTEQEYTEHLRELNIEEKDIITITTNMKQRGVWRT